MLPNSAAARDVAYLLHPATNARLHESTGPVIMERGEGIYVFDDAGNRYIEGMSGLWNVAIGFNEPRLVEAAARQMGQLPYYHMFSHRSNGPAIDLAEKLVTMTPERLKHVFFTNSGSEANDTVVKMVWYYNNARGRSRKKAFLARQNGYHGITVASGSLTGLAVNQRDFDLPAIPVHRLTCPHFYRYGLAGESEEAFSDRLAAELEALIEAEGADTIAALIGEPVMGAGGVMPPPVGYWQKIQAICRRHDILIVADEVINGFGRVGAMFACDYYGIDPDVLVVSKQLTSSYLPLAAVLMSEDLYRTIADHSEKMRVFGHGFTTTGHPVACAVALENLAIIEERDLVANAKRSGDLMQAALRDLADHPLVGEVRGVGLIAGVELVADKATKKPFDPVGSAGTEFYRRAHANGLVVRAIGDTVALCPPLIITEAQVGDMMRRFVQSLEEVTAWAARMPAAVAAQ